MMMPVPAAVAILIGLVVHLTTSAAAIGLPNCTTRCGDVSVPYPFGLSPGCYLPGFNLTCDTSRRDENPRLLLGDDGLQVVNISLRNARVRVIGMHIRFNSTTAEADRSRGVWRGLPDDGGPLVVSPDRNSFVVTGCYALGQLSEGANDTVITGCASFCPMNETSSASFRDNRCSGIGCCQVPINWALTSYNVLIIQTQPILKIPNYLRGPPRQVFIAESAWFATNYNELLNNTGPRPTNAETTVVPVVLDWVIGKTSCGGTCVSTNSFCNKTGGGYVCQCENGYRGNPYVVDGCTDINECVLQETKCYGVCTNLQGSFSCVCPRGTRGDPLLDPVIRGGGCSKSSRGLSIGIGISSGTSLLLVVLGASFLTRKLKKRSVKRQRQKNFKKNHGQLLEQLVSQHAEISERMIISLAELEKSTNNFDESREIGGGGHGIVYKGILSDQNVVAIKKSKIVIQREIDEFINEVVTLSQINHRNIVKLFGCCLETQVPLLVYEFISNGTLYKHLHVEGPKSLCWDDRLRIATGTARALAYLHSATAVPIIHRDIKSSNILLDDSLTAKVSDFGASRYIPIDETGVNTAVQGTFGYLDPMYYYTGRLTEKSDVYSFGVVLVELLTRKKPFACESDESDGLLAHFAASLPSGNLHEILDRQVLEEGNREVINIVANLAAACIKLKGEDRPTMRQVEMRLESLIEGSKEHLPLMNVREAYQENSVAVTGTLIQRRCRDCTSVCHTSEDSLLL
ncbi:unnamed protein product [Urochloa decumbens]|uniref:Protein kinase domain-containing protein n=1 Tax=Urochloa decumbens TaxID=240449 RepID=A0ABC9C2W3_9POAL